MVLQGYLLIDAAEEQCLRENSHVIRELVDCLGPEEMRESARMWWRRAGRHSSQPEESKWLGLFLPKHQARQTTVSGSPLKCGGEVSGGEVKREGGNGQVLMGRCQSSGDCGKWRCFRLLRSLPAADGLASMPKASRLSPSSTSSSFVGSPDTGARYVTNATVSRDNLEILPTIALFMEPESLNGQLCPGQGGVLLSLSLR